MKKNFELHVHPLSEVEFIATIDSDKEFWNKSKTGNVSARGQNDFINTVVILDRSGSMGPNVAKVMNQVLPELFAKLRYTDDDVIHIIAFDDRIKYTKLKVKELAHQHISARGGTHLAKAVFKLQNLLSSLKKNKPVRLMTISDGEVQDKREVKTAGAELANYVSNMNIQCNSQAVRLFTSYLQPDTTALCTMLQINNTTSCQLIDIDADNCSIEIAAEMAKLFESDGLGYGSSLSADSPIFFKFPWLEPTEKLLLSPGKNVFWLKKLPAAHCIRIEDADVSIHLEPQVTLFKFHALLDSKLDYVLQHVKVLKIVETDVARENIKKVLQYFEERESALTEEAGDFGHLRSRLQQIISSKKKKITIMLATIANDDKICQLNAAQKADFLRQTDASTRSARGLAKRATKTSLDFDEVARGEVAAIAAHFDEIEHIDDSNHMISFYSQETTMGGIRALVELSQHEVTFDALEILQILNCVGIGCNAPIGDYPDPMTWKIKDIVMSCHISLSDVLVAHIQSGGQPLKAPASEIEITNVIPVFEDLSIGKFLKKYAPSILEYTFSIGMRRMIAEIPMTIGFTMCSGILKMIPELNKNKSTINLEVFQKFVKTFNNFVGNYFGHVDELLVEKNQGELAFYLGNNGIQNLICPLIRMYQKRDQSKLKLVPSIMRSLISHEAWLIVRRAYKNDEKANEIAKEMLHKLLGIDLVKHKTELTPFDEPEPEVGDVKFHDEPFINYEYLHELWKPVNKLKYLVTTPELLNAAINNRLGTIKDMPTTDDATFLKSLQIDYDLKTFKFLTIFQALVKTSRNSRECFEEKKMKITDLKHQERAMNDVKDYVREQFESQYTAEVAARLLTVSKAMGEVAAHKILKAENYQELTSIWRSGVDYGDKTYKVATTSSHGFQTLFSKLCNVDEKVPLRHDIIKILLLGTDSNKNAVWNHGGVCYLHKKCKVVREAFLTTATIDDWTQIMHDFNKLKKIYRESLNRHGHGNPKPSYWAFGNKTLQYYRDVVDVEEFRAYCKLHRDCCGVRHLEQDFLESLA